MILRSIILKFTKFGRYLDLIAGIVLIGLGWYWHSWLTAAFGALALFTFAIDLNGMIQRRTMKMAIGVVQRRQAHQNGAGPQT